MDFIVSTFYVIITLYILFCVLFTTFFIMRFVGNLRKEIAGIKNAKQSNLASVKLVYVEQVNGMAMMYDRYNQNFVAQAATEDELWTRAQALFPNNQLILSDNPNLTTAEK
jgi:hypothetical protein